MTRLSLALYAGAALCCVALAALPVLADTLDLRGTTVTLRPTSEPGALAEVVMHNAEVNWSGDDGDYTLTIPGLTVAAAFQWDAEGQSDRITITPPDGIACAPSCVLTVPEGEFGAVYLFPFIGM